jgi:hypothetical protein
MDYSLHEETVIDQVVHFASRLTRMNPGDPGMLCSVNASKKGIDISCVTYEELAGVFWVILLSFIAYRFITSFIDCVVKGCCKKD